LSSLSLFIGVLRHPDDQELGTTQESKNEFDPDGEISSKPLKGSETL